MIWPVNAITETIEIIKLCSRTQADRARRPGKKCPIEIIRVFALLSDRTLAPLGK